MSRSTLATAFLAICLCGPATAQVPAPTRVALVIGNAAYKEGALANPINDAADVAKALEAGGFTVIRRDNATLREMHLALREFGDKLTRNATGVFYFAGHGLQVRGRNFLVPVDADIAREDEVAFAALDLAAVTEKLDTARNPVNLVILDACRNNPFAARFQSTAKGLAQVEAPPGTLIAFATAPGSVAADGGGRNGLYTQHLAREMARPGVAVEEVFKSVRAAVRKDSKGLQIPWESTSLESAFSFVPAPKIVMAPSRTVPAAVDRGSPADYLALPKAFVVGDRWSYVVRNLLDQSERLQKLEVTDVQADQVTLSSGQILDPVGNIKRSVALGRISHFSPPIAYYFFPMRPGASWGQKERQEIDGRVYELSTKVTVGAEEVIETPAGRLQTIRLERVSDWSRAQTDDSGTSKWTYWYHAPAKRYVRAEHQNITSKGKFLSHDHYEIESFDVK